MCQDHYTSPIIHQASMGDALVVDGVPQAGTSSVHNYSLHANIEIYNHAPLFLHLFRPRN